MVLSMSASALSPNGRQFYIPKTCSSTPSETESGIFTIFDFKVTEILDENKDDCNYKRIRIKAVGSSSGTKWLKGVGFTGDPRCTAVYGLSTPTMIIQAYIGVYFEIVSSNNSYENYSFYYYVNDPDKDAYATIESDYS